MEHPNLAVWRWLHAGLDPADQVMAVFAAGLDTPCADPT